MTLRRSEKPFSASAFSSPVPSHDNFSTRTRLRPGGPTLNPTNHFDNLSRNGSLPSFEGIGMRTLDGRNQGQFLANRRPYLTKTLMAQGIPATPLVKQKTAGCSSPRVQMYRTRVVYSDVRDEALKAAQEAAAV